MPTVLTCTIFMGSDEGKGWTETHHKSVDTVPGNLQTELLALKALADNYRRPLLGSDCYLKGLRVSYRTTTGAVASSAFKYQPFSFPSNKKDSASPNVAAQMRMGEASNTQFSNVFLRGFWDNVERNEQLDFTTADGAAWKSLLDQYVAALVSGNYGWLGANAPTMRRGKITDYTTDPDGFVSFAITIDQGPALPAVGTILPFRAARLNNSKSPLNRSMIVKVDSAASVKTVVPTAAGPFVSQGTYVINSTGFLKYTGMQYASLARRAAGRPLGESPARLKARPRY